MITLPIDFSRVRTHVNLDARVSRDDGSCSGACSPSRGTRRLRLHRFTHNTHTHRGVSMEAPIVPASSPSIFVCREKATTQLIGVPTCYSVPTRAITTSTCRWIMLKQPGKPAPYRRRRALPLGLSSQYPRTIRTPARSRPRWWTLQEGRCRTSGLLSQRDKKRSFGITQVEGGGKAISWDQLPASFRPERSGGMCVVSGRIRANYFCRICRPRMRMVDTLMKGTLL